MLPLSAAPEAETDGAAAAREAEAEEAEDAAAEAGREAVIEAAEAEADDADATTACEADETAMEGAARVELEVELEDPEPVIVSGAALTRAPVPVD